MITLFFSCHKGVGDKDTENMPPVQVRQRPLPMEQLAKQDANTILCLTGLDGIAATRLTKPILSP
jgi:hypothetical protein